MARQWLRVVVVAGAVAAGIGGLGASAQAVGDDGIPVQSGRQVSPAAQESQRVPQLVCLEPLV